MAVHTIYIHNQRIKMAKKISKTLYVDVNVAEEGIFSKFLSKRAKESDYDPSDIELLRTIFSNEKTKILYTIKKHKPKSIYELAKILKRDFKSVYKDLKVLERFEFIEFYSEKVGNRESLRPVLALNELNITISI
jgi:predicted transcriptional regulator